MAECVFCGRLAIIKNEQKFPVCSVHKESEMPDMKCACGEYLDMRESKFGPFFVCINCGTVSLKKALSMNPITKEVAKKAEEKKGPVEITVRSDEVDFI